MQLHNFGETLSPTNDVAWVSSSRLHAGKWILKNRNGRMAWWGGTFVMVASHQPREARRRSNTARRRLHQMHELRANYPLWLVLANANVTYLQLLKFASCQWEQVLKSSRNSKVRSGQNTKHIFTQSKATYIRSTTPQEGKWVSRTFLSFFLSRPQPSLPTQ